MDVPIFLAAIDLADTTSSTGSLPPAGFSATQAGSSGNYLDGGNPASLQVVLGDKFIFGGWFKPNNVADGTPFTKGDIAVGGSEDYGVFYTTNTISFGMVAGVTEQYLTSSIPLSVGTAYFILCWYDGTNQKIQVNANTPDSQAVVLSQVADLGGNVTFFANDDVTHSNGEKGTLDEWFFCKNPSNFATALATIQANIYNGGTGIRFKNVATADKTTIGLVSWWTFDEASAATRKDSYGTNDLTLHGTITQSTPIVA